MGYDNGEYLKGIKVTSSILAIIAQLSILVDMKSVEPLFESINPAMNSDCFEWISLFNV